MYFLIHMVFTTSGFSYLPEYVTLSSNARGLTVQIGLELPHLQLNSFFISFIKCVSGRFHKDDFADLTITCSVKFFSSLGKYGKQEDLTFPPANPNSTALIFEYIIQDHGFCSLKIYSAQEI